MTEVMTRRVREGPPTLAVRQAFLDHNESISDHLGQPSGKVAFAPFKPKSIEDAIEVVITDCFTKCKTGPNFPRGIKRPPVRVGMDNIQNAHPHYPPAIDGQLYTRRATASQFVVHSTYGS